MIDNSANQLDTVNRILADHLQNCKVLAFGLRVAGSAKAYSDLDLALVGDGALDMDRLWRLKEALQESDLPFRVDMLDWHTISDRFRAVIETNCEVICRGIR